jgi:SAM-dependent methyltransferase
MAIAETTRITVEQCYRDYGARKGPLRNDLLRNPEVLFQVLATEVSMLSALRFVRPDPARAKVLDVGCGDGSSLLPLLRLGFEPSNLYGVDIRGEQIAVAQARFPGLRLQCDDASSLKFPDASFDIVQESMMFLQMTDQVLEKKVAQQMIRVTKPGGCLLLSDWRYGKPGISEFKPLNRRRIAELFRVGSATEIHRSFSGALIPPIGRFLSKNLPALYFLTQSLLPFAVGQVTTVLTRAETPINNHLHSGH